MATLLVACAMALSLAACAGEFPQLSESAAVTAAAQDARQTAGLSAGGVATSVPTEPDPSRAVIEARPTTPKPFNPFSEDTAITDGPREVIQNPTIAEVMQAGPLPEVSLGRDTAPITLIKYASLTCPFCRQFQTTTYPELKRRYIDTGKVRLIMREFPIGLQSGTATIALRCVEPAKYMDLYGRFLAQQARWVSQEVRRDPIFEIARQVGLSRADFDACYQNRALIDGLKWVKDRGRTLGIIGTPNFFLNGRLIKTVLTMKEIETLVEAELAKSSSAPAEAQRG